MASAAVRTVIDLPSTRTETGSSADTCAVWNEVILPAKHRGQGQHLPL